MNQKTLLGLGIATVAVVGIAWFALHDRESAVQATNEKTKLYPELASKVNDVASITFQKNAETWTIRRAGDTWGLAEKDDFPVDVEAVRKTILGIADMTVVEPKTKKPEQYEKLDVQDPSSAGAKGVQVTLTDKGGAQLVQLVVGKEHDSKGALMTNQRYVRKAGEAQSWLVQGTIDAKEKSTDWLQKKIVEVKRDRVRSIEVAHADGETLKVDREKADQQDFTLHDLPEGKELTYPTAPGSLASSLEYLSLEDVQPIAKVDFSQGTLATTTFRTFDGLVIKATVKDEGEKSFARFEASYEAPPTPPAPAEGEAKPAEGDAPPATAQKTPEEVQKEAAELNARLSKWAYGISSWSKTSFAKRKAELLKDKAPPAPPPGEGGANAGAGAGSDAFAIPSNLPPEIQEAIKKDQEAKGNKTLVVDPATNTPVEAPADATKPDANKPADAKPSEAPPADPKPQ